MKMITDETFLNTTAFVLPLSQTAYLSIMLVLASFIPTTYVRVSLYPNLN